MGNDAICSQAEFKLSAMRLPRDGFLLSELMQIQKIVLSATRPNQFHAWFRKEWINGSTS
jgi:hypothetical protein